MVQKIHLLHITYSTIFVTKLIYVAFELNLCWWLFLFAIRLIHFRDDFAFLFYGSYGSVTISTPGLSSNVLYKSVLTWLAFLWIIGSNVDRVHFLHFKLLYFIRSRFITWYTPLFIKKYSAVNLCYFLFFQFFYFKFAFKVLIFIISTLIRLTHFFCH